MKAMICAMLIFQANFCLAEEKCSGSQITTELEQVFERDQGLRMDYTLAQYDQKFEPSTKHSERKEKALLDLRAGDRQNYSVLMNIINSCGWPDAKLLSYRANSALFFVVQHGSKDDRIKYFPYFEQQYKDKQLHSSRIAMMKDRMRWDLGLPQLYGTHYLPDKEGLEAYGNVEEPEKLNQRREDAGLSRILIFDKKYPPQLSGDISTEKK